VVKLDEEATSSESNEDTSLETPSPLTSPNE